TALGQRSHITIFGDDYDTNDGTCVRDYVHVEDLIDAHLLALKYLQAGGESNIFNLGSSQGFSVKEMIDTARSVTCKEDRKSTRLNSSHVSISYAVFCLKK